MKSFFKYITLAFTLILTTSLTQASNNKLYVYNWSEYIPNHLIKQFTKETGIEVIYSTYESNDEMYSKFKITNGEGYDIIFPSSYFVEKLVQDKLIQPIDKSRLKNYSQIYPNLLNLDFDKDNKYSIPYAFGFTAISVNTSEIKDKITSWNDLWNPKYKGRVILLNDSRDVFSVALLSLGLDPNTRKEEDIKKAYDKLKELLPSVSTFNSDSPEVSYLQGEGDIGMIWSGSALRGSQENQDLKIVYPKEGSILWIDNFAISAKSKNLDAAYQFIDFILKTESGVQITKEMGFTTSNKNSISLLPDEYKNNIAINVGDENIKKSHINSDVGNAINLYSKYWNLLKTSN